MTYRNLDKINGFSLSVFCFLFYMWIFRTYNLHFFGVVPPRSSWNTIIFTLGVILHLMYIIPPGETATLTFGAKSTGKIWEDGLVFVPNIFHFTIPAFNFAVLWGLVLNNKERAAGQNYVHAEVFTHQMMPQYHRTTQMSKTAADLDRAANAFLFWLFGWRNGEPHLALMRFGFRLMVLGYIGATITGMGSYASKKAEESANQAANALNSAVGSAVQGGAQFLGVPPRSQTGMVTVKMSFCQGRRPIMPRSESFWPITNPRTNVYQMVEDDPRKYVRYNDVSPGGVYALQVTEPLCAIVPPGREIFLASSSPPQCALNMEQQVDYVEAENPLPFFTIHTNTQNSWRYVNRYWGKIDTGKYGYRGKAVIHAKALERSDLPPGSSGGLVCF